MPHGIWGNNRLSTPMYCYQNQLPKLHDAGYLCRCRHVHKGDLRARQRAVSLIKLRNDISQSIPGIEAYRTSSELVVSAVRYMLVRCWFANSPRRDTETPQLLSVDLSVVIPLACQIVTRLLLRQLIGSVS